MVVPVITFVAWMSWSRAACQAMVKLARPGSVSGRVLVASAMAVRNRAEARIKISTWIADFYNTSRRQTANDGLAPTTFERQMAQARSASTPGLRAEVA
ncbi:hypothetical protein [Actinomadura sp. HBU206391]|uniref:hypothetical protein n=1 Tax=Actinomadura sp. HBU206391 TaxID=2731692 RepID=UPI00164FDE9E|nr:hypothetical protein [Actinomadura sp. HBU206391]MBC6463826.1 hypothetical protein [Actinomadura sp. HBU206391]